MKICYIAGSVIPSRTANSVHVMKMCQAYARQGHDVTLVVPDHEQAVQGIADVYEYYGVEHNFRILKLRLFRPLKFWYAIVMTWRSIRETHADLYHTRIVWTAWGLTALFKKQTMLEIHEVPSPGSLLAKCYQRTTNLRPLHAVISITHALKNRLAKLTSEQAKVVVAPDGVATELVDSRVTQDDARSQLNMTDDLRFLVAYTGHLYPGRGIEIVVEMAQRHPEFQFQVVGGRESEIDQWRAETTDVSNLTFVGFVPPNQVFTYLLAADALLMPYANHVSHSGSGDISAVISPMKMFEYMASGRPVIASDLPVLQEVLQPESNCLVAQYDDLDAWSHQLDRLSNDCDLRCRLGDQAKEDVASYTWESRAKKIVEFSGVNVK